MADKPTIFIGSSSEAEAVAEAVLIKLDKDYRPKIWANAFDLSSITITTLINRTKEVDYAVFVFHPDDQALIRGEEYYTVRDNVLLELGMFIGSIGLERCFILVPKSSEKTFRLPSDLAGVTASYYDDLDQQYTDAVTSSCAKIKQSISQIESQKNKTISTSEVDILTTQVNALHSQIWSLTHDLQSANEKAFTSTETIRQFFFSIAKPATPAEIKSWEDGATKSQLKEVKIDRSDVYYVDQDVIIPSLHGASSISIIVAAGVKVYCVDRWSHNTIYYMDGFRTDSHL